MSEETSKKSEKPAPKRLRVRVTLVAPGLRIGGEPHTLMEGVLDGEDVIVDSPAAIKGFVLNRRCSLVGGHTVLK